MRNSRGIAHFLTGSFQPYTHGDLEILHRKDLLQSNFCQHSIFGPQEPCIIGHGRTCALWGQHNIIQVELAVDHCKLSARTRKGGKQRNADEKHGLFRSVSVEVPTGVPGGSAAGCAERTTKNDKDCVAHPWNFTSMVSHQKSEEYPVEFSLIARMH